MDFQTVNDMDGKISNENSIYVDDSNVTLKTKNFESN